ncbi:hypothetical protein V6N12_056545 [Hibiscus sabdariffa]|uniref:Beta-glucosidase n=1 Tax=Hibiscus sabdariffa TaxID=183260 RepID=A0ABR2CSU4_9ROSI
MVLLRKGIAFGIITVLALGLIQTGFSQNISRASFPKGFIFGTASASFQFEGAVKEDGRGPTIWDTFSHTFGKILDGSNADVAVDQYHRYPGDIQLMKDMGMDAYRFSIAWSRIFPNGSGAINQAGVDHYNNFINALLAAGIEPVVTLYHWDLPQALEDKYNGWLDRQIIEDFAIYAETCFKLFVDIYRKKYKAKQHGQVGVSFNVIWFEPETNSTEDIEAAQRAQDFQLGWFLDPLMFGDYPNSMVTRVGSRLPRFTKAESALLKGSLDFVGINHYTTFYARENKTNLIGSILHDTVADSGTFTSPFKNGKTIGEKANSIWIYVVPRGMRSIMNYVKQKYGNPPVIVTENGYDDPNSPFISIKNALKDEKRIRYHNDYLTNLLAAIKEDGCNVKGTSLHQLRNGEKRIADVHP